MSLKNPTGKPLNPTQLRRLAKFAEEINQVGDFGRDEYVKFLSPTSPLRKFLDHFLSEDQNELLEDCNPEELFPAFMNEDSGEYRPFFVGDGKLGQFGNKEGRELIFSVSKKIRKYLEKVHRGTYEKIMMNFEEGNENSLNRLLNLIEKNPKHIKKTYLFKLIANFALQGDPVPKNQEEREDLSAANELMVNKPILDKLMEMLTASDKKCVFALIDLKNIDVCKRLLIAKDKNDRLLINNEHLNYIAEEQNYFGDQEIKVMVETRLRPSG